MDFWNFKARRQPIITPIKAEKILTEKPSKIDVSIGLGKIAQLSYDGEQIILEFNEREYIISRDELERISSQDERRLFGIDRNGVYRLHESDGKNYYQLVLVEEDRAPTVEINGVHMHRVKDILPFEDAKIKVKKLRIRRGMNVLDICTGLGYTAIWEHRMGANVISVEISEIILKLAEWNPWSEGLENVKIIHGDAFYIIENFDNNSFHRVLNDPPRYTFASELYSKTFFREIYRILKPKGILFQYTGRAREHIRGGIIKGVMNRLRDVGFVVRYDNQAQGVIAIKPGRRRY